MVSFLIHFLFTKATYLATFRFIAPGLATDGGMLFNPFLHNQPFANQLGKREKLACFQAKQPIIIAISRTGPAASIPNLSSFRAYYELIMSSFPGSPNATSPPDQSPPTRPIPNAAAVQDRAARSEQKPSQPAVLLFPACPSSKKLRVMAEYQS